MQSWAEPTSSLEILDQADTLKVRQRVDVVEAAFGFQVRNRYTIDAGEGRHLFAFELGGRLWGWLVRQILKTKRPFRMEIRDEEDRPFLRFRRPFRFIFDRLEIRDPQDRLLGAVRRRLTLLRRIYVVEDSRGMSVAELYGPIMKPWTFEIRVRDRVEGHIRKLWSGLGKEMFTGADNFQVSFGPGIESRHRPLYLGATFLIDYLHFER